MVASKGAALDDANGKSHSALGQLSVLEPGYDKEAQEDGSKELVETKARRGETKGVDVNRNVSQASCLEWGSSAEGSKDQTKAIGRASGGGDIPPTAVELTLAWLVKNINWDLEDYFSETEEGGIWDLSQAEGQVGNIAEGATGPGAKVVDPEKGGGGTCKWVSKGNVPNLKKAPDYGLEKKVGRPPKKVTREKETLAQIDMGYQSTLKEGVH